MKLQQNLAPTVGCSSGGTVNMLHHPQERQTVVLSSVQRPEELWGTPRHPMNGVCHCGWSWTLRWNCSTGMPAIPWPLHATTKQLFNKLHCSL